MDRQGDHVGDKLAWPTGPDQAPDGPIPDWALNLTPRHPDVVAAQNRLVDLHTAWTEQQLTGYVPFHPDEHPPGSDYNQHNVDLEATGDELDDLAVASALALGHIPPYDEDQPD